MDHKKEKGYLFVILTDFQMKNLRLLGVPTLLFLLISFLACTTQNVDMEGSEPCPNAGEFVKKVESVMGLVQFDSTRQQYTIRRALPSTYDSVDVGYLCYLPEEFRQSGLKVEFSGSYYENNEVPASFAGLENYYLSVTKIAKAR